MLRVARRIDRGEYFASDATIAEASGLNLSDVRLAALALERRGYVTLTKYMGGEISFRDVDGAAYLITGLHPDADDALDALVDLLRQAADQAGDEDERGRLKRAASSLLDVSRGAMSGVLTAYLAGQIPH